MSDSTTTADLPAMSPRQAAFVAEYLVDRNATHAAIRCGYSPRTATAQASRLLSKVNIQAEIARLQAEATTDAVLTHRETLEILTRIARANFADFITADGRIDLAAVRSARPEGLVSLDVLSDGSMRLRLADRVKAIERLAKLLGWDSPARVQTEDVTPTRYDLSKLSDEELTAFEGILEKLTPA